MKENTTPIMRNVTIYADTTGLFSEAECNCDNLVDMDFPEWIVKEWYRDHEYDFAQETSHDLNKPVEDCTYEDWVTHIVWAGDTDGLYDYAKERGFIGNCGIGKHSLVFYRDDNNFKTVVFEGTYDECREYGRSMGWETNDGYELEVQC